MEPTRPWHHGWLSTDSNLARPKQNSPWARFSECLLFLAQVSLPTNHPWSLPFPHRIQPGGSYLQNLLKISPLLSISSASTLDTHANAAFCQDNGNNLNQGVVTMACYLFFYIKLYWLAQSCDCLLTHCLWLLSYYNSRPDSLPASQSKCPLSVYPLPCYHQIICHIPTEWPYKNSEYKKTKIILNLSLLGRLGGSVG